MTINDVKIIELPKVLDTRGNLSFFEENKHIPFKIKRVYWIYDVPGGEVRGGHAYYQLSEIIIALSGSFDICINDGVDQKVITLNRSYYAVYVPKMIWRQLQNFSTNSLAFIAASRSYDADDYIREYKDFVKIKKL